MAVTHPTTRLDLFTVPWGKPEECHAIVDFPTAAAQVAAFDDLAAKGVSATKFNYIKKIKRSGLRATLHALKPLTTADIKTAIL